MVPMVARVPILFLDSVNLPMSAISTKLYFVEMLKRLSASKVIDM